MNKEGGDSIEEEQAVLSLQGKDLVEVPLILIKEVQQRQQLLCLDMSRNKICTIPTALYEMTSLIQLDLSRNHLTDIPNGVSRLVHLKELNLLR